MSVRIMAAVWEIPMPPTDKLVLLALADCADEAGLCWPSISTIARKSGVSERSVQRAIRKAEKVKLVVRDEVAGKGCKYRINPRHCGTPASASPPTDGHQTPDTVAPKPSRTTKPKKGKPSLVAHELPDDWQPQPFGLDTESRKVVDGWPPGELPRQIEHFRAHHCKNGSKWKNWQSAWSTWVLNARNFGNGRSGSYPLAGNQPGGSRNIGAAIAVFGEPRARHP